MTQQKTFKARIRERMSKTGESFAAARAQLLAGSATIPPTMIEIDEDSQWETEKDYDFKPKDFDPERVDWEPCLHCSGSWLDGDAVASEVRPDITYRIRPGVFRPASDAGRRCIVLDPGEFGESMVVSFLDSGKWGCVTAEELVEDPRDGRTEGPFDRRESIATSLSAPLDILAAALAREPRLTDFGLGIFDEHVSKPWGQREHEFIKLRRDLAGRLDAVSACVDWIRLHRVRQTFNMKMTSYGYKHSVEKWCRDERGLSLSVSNGSFIAAALGLGLEGKRASKRSPNMHFKLSERPSQEGSLATA